MLKYGPILFLFLVAGCAEPTVSDEQRFIDGVAEAMGGRTAVTSARTLTLEGEGRILNLGQDIVPESMTKEFGITDLQLTLDLTSVSSLTRRTRTPLFPYFLGNHPIQQTFGVAGDVAYDLNLEGSARRMPAHVAWERQTAYYHHPFPLLHAVLQGAARIQNVAEEDGFALAEVVTADGKPFTIALDPNSQLPVWIRSTVHHPYLRDVIRTTHFDDYQTVKGVKLPSVLMEQLDEFTVANWRVLSQTISAEIADIPAPPAAVAAPPPSGNTPVEMAVEPIGKGVWLLVGRGYNSALIEFSDHLMLVEAPDVSHTIAALAKAADLVPDKPVTQLVNSHYHFDHSAGVRRAIAEGLTIITHATNAAFYRRLAQQPSTLVPDALSESPKDLVIEAFDDKASYEDETMTVELYHLEGSPHTDGLIMAYVPRERVVIQVDAFTPGSRSPQTSAPNLLENIRRHGLDVERIVPLHNNIVALSALEDAVAKLESAGS